MSIVEGGTGVCFLLRGSFEVAGLVGGWARGRGRRVFGYLISALPDDHGCFGFFFTTCVCGLPFCCWLLIPERLACWVYLPPPPPPPTSFVLGLSCGWCFATHRRGIDSFFFVWEGKEMGGSLRVELLARCCLCVSLTLCGMGICLVRGRLRQRECWGGGGYLDARWGCLFLNLC